MRNRKTILGKRTRRNVRRLGELLEDRRLLAAIDDMGSTAEDTVLTTVEPGATTSLLANDTTPGAVVVAYDATSQWGAEVVVNADGTFSYDPTAAPALRALDNGETLTDTFTYSIVPSFVPISNTNTGVAATVLGTGTAALLGGDLTDPENDGDPEADINYNATFNANNEPNFGGGEGAFNVFDNQLGSGNAKWCCDGPGPTTPDGQGLWVSAEFDQPYVLTHFTLSSGNDSPDRDPRVWSIEGSADGSTWEPIYSYNNTGASPFTARDQVLLYTSSDGRTDLTGGATHFETNIPYTHFRYFVDATNLASGAAHQLGEVELFGNPLPVETATVSIVVSGQSFTQDDTGATNENTPLSVPPPGVLANDDPGYEVAGNDALSANGAAVSVGATGSYVYDPTGSAAIQALEEGETLVDTFEYTIAQAPAPVVNTNTGNAGVSRGTGAAALLGGDLTDPENDGAADANTNYNAIFNANNEPDFGGGEFAFNVFDNQVGGGNAKWCCDSPGPTTPDGEGLWVSAQFSQRYVLTHFTITSGNDGPERDPRVWSIEGSNDGVTWEPIYEYNNTSASPFAARSEVLLYTSSGGRTDLTGGVTHFESNLGYDRFRYFVDATGLEAFPAHQLNELEFFGVPYEAGDILDVATVFITVTGVNDAPVAVADTNSITESSGTPAVNQVSGNVLSNDTDVDDDPSAFAVTNPGTVPGMYGSLLLNADGTYTYTLDDNNPVVDALLPTESISDTFNYTVTDDGSNPLTASGTLTITINGVNDPPRLSDNTATVTEDTASTASGNLITDDDGDGADTDPESPSGLTVAGVDGETNPANDVTGNYGTLNWAADGSYTYTLNNANPDVQSLAAGETLTDSFTYTAADTFATGDGLFQVYAFQEDNTGADIELNTTTETLGIWQAIDGGATVPGNVEANGTNYGIGAFEGDVETRVIYNADRDGFTGSLAYETINADGPGGSGGSIVAGDDFSVLARAFLVFNVGGTYSISAGSDDGRLISLTEASPGSAPGYAGFTAAGDQTTAFTPGSTTVMFNDPSGHAHTTGVFNVNAGDTLFLTTFFFERGGGDEFHVSVKRGNDTTHGGTGDGWQLLQDGAVGIAVSSTNSFTRQSTATATLNVTIVGSNDAPTANPDTAAAGEDGPAVNIDLAGNDTDPDTSDTLTVSAVEGDAGPTVTLPSGASVTISGGSISYDPSGAFDYLTAGETAVDTFTYTIADGNGGTSDSTVSVTITGANDAPTAVDDTAAVSEDGPAMFIDVLANDMDSDIDGTAPDDTLTVTGTGGSPLGTVTFTPAGVTYDPAGQFESLAAGDTATDTFTYTMEDAAGASSTATVVVTITGANDAPANVDAGGPYMVAEGGSLSLNGSFTDVDTGDSHTITWTINGLVAPSATALDSTLTWEQLQALGVDDGDDTFTVTLTVEDSSSAAVTSADGTINLENTPPTAAINGATDSDPAPTTAVLGIPVEFTFSAVDPSDADQAGNFTFEVDWGDGTTQSFTGPSPWMVSHAFQNFGLQTITVTATDDDGGTSTEATHEIDIVPVAVVGDDLQATGTASSDTIIVYPVLGGVRVRYNNVTYPSDGGAFTFPGQVVMMGEGGSDRLIVANGMDHSFVIDGGDGNDYIAGGVNDDTITGGAGNDVILAGEGNNYIDGGEGSDRLEARSGNDVIFGGDGNDRINGGAGDDVLDGGNDNDMIFGDVGNDLLHGGSGVDTLQGHYGNDVVLGGDDADQIFGGEGNDLMLGGLGSDRLRGDGGDDDLIGGTSELDDDIEAALDAMLASLGTDLATASPSVANALNAWFNSGSDRSGFGGFDNSDGLDELTGGAGVDEFHSQSDTIRDFREGESLIN